MSQSRGPADPAPVRRPPAPDGNELRVFAFGLAAGLLARAVALVSPAPGVDDLVYWNYDHYGFDVVARHAFSEGRFLYPVLTGFADALGINAPRAFALSGAVLCAALALAAVLLCRLWRIMDDLRLGLLVSGLFVLHPYFTDVFAWKMAMLTAGPPLVLALAGLVAARHSWPAAAGGAGLLVLALGGHQLPLGVCTAAAGFAVVLDVARARDRLPTPAILAEHVRMLAVLAVGTLAYVLIARSVIASLHEPSMMNRDVLIVATHPGLVLRRAVELVRLMAFGDPLVSPGLRSAFALLAAAGAGGLIRGRPNADGIARAVLLALAIALGAAGAVGLTSVPVAWAPSFRNLCAAAVAWAGVGAVGYLASPARLRPAILAVAGLVAVGFIGVSNEMLSDQLRAADRDRSLMTRIAGRLEALPNSPSLERVAFIGRTTAPLARLRTGLDASSGWGGYGTTLSVFAFFADGYLVHLLNEVTGYRLSFAIPPEQLRRARLICEGRGRWPAPDSVTSDDRTGIVCLGPPVGRARTRFDVPES
jgi:hypothetical protein